MRLRKHSIQNIVESINLQDHLRRFLEIKRTGSHAIAKCPFHQDTSPSLYIYPTNYHCFACKAHGTVIDYEMHRTGASFREAVESLSESYQIPLEYEDPTDRDQKNLLSSAFFEKQNKNLIDMHLFFKENLAQFCQNSQNKNQKFISFLETNITKFIDFSYTGSEAECRDFFANREIIFSSNFSIADRLVFPVYKDNGKINGFLFSKKISQALNNIEDEYYLELLKELEVYTPFPKSFIACLNWQVARAHATKAKELYVVTNLLDLLEFSSRGIPHVVACIQAKLDINLAKIFSKRVPVVTLVIKASPEGNAFLWNTFLDTIYFDDLTLQVLNTPANPYKLKDYFVKFNSNDLSKWLANSKSILDEVTQKTLEAVPSSQKVEEFKKKILPVINGINNIVRKNRLLDYLSEKFFGSSKEILLRSRIEARYSHQENLNNNIQNPEIKKEKPILRNSQSIADEKEFLNKTIQFYHRILLSENNFYARDYLKERGISLEQIIKWNLGYAPFSNELSRKVETKKIDANIPFKLGLIKKSKIPDRYFDLFHDRIIIPIYGNDGAPVALAGRLFMKSSLPQAKEMPKYINSPESDLFSKSNILFNFHGALRSIVSYGYVIVVEGYMDCISLVNAGIANTVAVMGTALTQAHMDALTKVTKRILICFDSDKAGQNAAKRSFSIAFPFSGVELEYLSLPEGKDPDEYIRKFGAERFLALTAERIPLLNKICDWLYEESNAQLERFFKLIKENVLSLVLLHPNLQIQNEALSFLCDKYFPSMTVMNLRKEMENSSLLQVRPLLAKETEISQDIALESWSVLNVHEIKFLFTLVHSKFAELPERLKNVAQGITSDEEADERICALALNHQMGSVSFSVFLELISVMVQNPYVSPIELENPEIAGYSHHAKILIAYVTSDAHVLLQYHKEELLKESLPVNASMISLKNIWDLKNSGFLRFQLRNVKMSSQRGGLTSFVAETLLHLELEYIDNALKAFSSFHFDDEIDKQFQDLVKERTRRRTKFSYFESFSLQ